MKDNFNNFEELQKSRSKSFEIVHCKRVGSFLFFTPHGGGIEPGTSEICNWFNKEPYSAYMFTGKGTNCKELHITSTNFNEPTLLELLNVNKYAISFHGMTNYLAKQIKADIYIGGLNTELIKTTTTILRNDGFIVKSNLEITNSRLSGKEPNNVTNRCISKKGMQIELSEKLRQKFFKGKLGSNKGRKITTEYLETFCNSILTATTLYLKSGLHKKIP